MNQVINKFMFLGVFFGVIAIVFSFAITAYAIYGDGVMTEAEVQADLQKALGSTSRNTNYNNYYNSYVPPSSGSQTEADADLEKALAIRNRPASISYGAMDTGPTINDANPGTSVGYVTPAKTKTVAVSTTKTVNNNTTNTTVAAPAPAVVAPEQNSSNSSLSALSWFGAPGFLPNTIFEWILTICLILVLMILIRQFRPIAPHEAHPTAVAHH